MNRDDDAANVLHSEIERNQQKLEGVLSRCADVHFHQWSYGDVFAYKAVTVYCSSLADYSSREFQHALGEIPSCEAEGWISMTPDKLRHCMQANNAALQPFVFLKSLGDACEAVMNGYVVILFDQLNQALGFPM